MGKKKENLIWVTFSCSLIQRCAHYPRERTTMSHLNLSPLFCGARTGGNKPQPPQRGTEHPWSSNLSPRCAVAYKDGAVIEVSTQQDI